MPARAEGEVAAERLVCLIVPLFPLAARLRSEPELLGEALAIFDGNGSAARLVGATRVARRAGLKPGLTLAQARALLPKLIARPRDEECERSAQEALLEAAETISPRIEDADDGVVYLDPTGLERHFSGDTFEHQLGRALMDAVESAGLPVRIGVAASKLAARMAAETPGSPTVIAAGDEADFLAPMPLARLSPEAKVLTTLERWGIRSIGELAHLPADEVSSRLGAVGQELHSIARGVDPRPLVPRRPPAAFREGTSLEWPLVALEPFLFVAQSALERLCRRMAGHGVAIKRLEISLELEPDGFYERALELPAPSREAQTLITLLRLELEARPPGAPVTGFRLTAYADRPREAQLSLFGPAALSPDRLAGTLARLFALLGRERVGSPRVVDGHRPERFALEDYAPPPPPQVRREPRPGRGLLTVRVLRPPVPMEVLIREPQTATRQDRGRGAGHASEIAEPPTLYGAGEGTAASEQDGSKPGTSKAGATEPDISEPGAASPRIRLLSVQSLADEDSRKRPKIHGRVRVASGPWQLEEAWWSGEPVGRDYWDVELSDGGLYRLYRNREDGEWFVDGIYD